MLRYKKFTELQFIRVFYWLFLTYMVVAFAWWYVALVKQNEQIVAIQLAFVQKNDVLFAQKIQDIQNFQLRKQKQYIGEGVTILFLFLLGAIYVYRSLNRQIRYANQQQNFMMAVTHELKTPIAITQLNMETLLKHRLDSAHQKKILTNSLHETQRLDTLCNNILLASQLDMGEYQTLKQEIELSFIVQNTLNNYKLRFPDRIFEQVVGEGIYIKGESVLIQLLLNNLIDNALKYSSNDTPILIQLQQQKDKIKLSVSDEGVGIPETDKEKIFEKFYRVGAEYTRSSKGTGLGLYLCKRIANFHQAKLEVNPNAPKGSIFTFTYFIK